MWTNEVKIGGKLFKKFDIKTSTNGKSYVAFTVHSSKEKKQQYTPVVAFGDVAEAIAELKEGSYLTVEGEISTKGLENKESGKKDYKTNVICHRFTCG